MPGIERKKSKEFKQLVLEKYIWLSNGLINLAEQADKHKRPRGRLCNFQGTLRKYLTMDTSEETC